MPLSESSAQVEITIRYGHNNITITEQSSDQTRLGAALCAARAVQQLMVRLAPEMANARKTVLQMSSYLTANEIEAPYQEPIKLQPDHNLTER